MPKIALIGAGKFGKNYLKLADKFPISFVTGNRDNWREVIASGVDGVVIATPPDSHVDIAIEVLKYNLPVMIEKPLGMSLKDCERLIPYKDNAPILVNYLHLFAPAFENMKEISPDRIRNIYSEGIGINSDRNYSALLDYGCHDIAMALYLFDQNVNITIQNVTKLKNEYCIKLIYKNMSVHTFVVDSTGTEKVRTFEIFTTGGASIEYRDDQKGILPLDRSFEAFLKSLNGCIDDRFGLDLSLKVAETIDKIEEALRQ